MKEVKVEFLGTFSSELGELNRTVLLKDEATLGDLIESLIQDLPKGERFKEMVLDEEGKKKTYVLLMMNYKLVYEDPLNVQIPDKAKVVFAMPSAGG
jgi:molybdopterin converting factor small subunit